MEPRVVLAGLTGEEATLNGETGIRVPVSLSETLLLPEVCRMNGECGAEDRDLIEVLLDKNGRTVEVRQGNTLNAVQSTVSVQEDAQMRRSNRPGSRPSTYQAVPQHIPGSIPLPSLADMKRVVKGDLIPKFIAFRADVYVNKTPWTE